MALNLTALKKPVSNMIVDGSTGMLRQDWIDYFLLLSQHLNKATGELSVAPAPADAQYIVGAANATLSAERVATASTSNTWNLTTPGQAAVERAALTGDVTAPANSNATTIAADAVTYAKMQNVSATARLLGRRSSGAGDVEECTITEALDFVGSAAQGDVLYRDAAAWDNLAAGVAGRFLTTQGAGQNPVWQAGAILLNSGSVAAAASLDIVLTSYTAYRNLWVVLDSLLPATDDRELWMRFSSNGGSSYDAAAGNYSYGLLGVADNNTTATPASTAAAQIVVAGYGGATNAPSNVAAEGGVDALIQLGGRTAAGRWTRALIDTVCHDAAGIGSRFTGQGAREAAQDTDAVRFIFETGNITSGNWSIYGVP